MHELLSLLGLFDRIQFLGFKYVLTVVVYLFGHDSFDSFWTLLQFLDHQRLLLNV